MQTNDVNIKYKDSTAIDAFGRLRVAEPIVTLESKLLGDAAPLSWDDAEASGSGTGSTYDINSSSVLLNWSEQK